MNKLELFKEAMSYYGLNEILDGSYNQEILSFLNEFSELPIKSNLPWCAAWVNHVLKESGYKNSGMLNARSFQKLGKAVKEPQLGDLAVFWRGKQDSWKGHVGFFVRETGNVIYILGGNQNNEVCIKAYLKSQLLSYRTIGLAK